MNLTKENYKSFGELRKVFSNLPVEVLTQFARDINVQLTTKLEKTFCYNYRAKSPIKDLLSDAFVRINEDGTHDAVVYTVLSTGNCSLRLKNYSVYKLEGVLYYTEGNRLHIKNKKTSLKSLHKMLKEKKTKVVECSDLSREQIVNILDDIRAQVLK